MSFFWRKDNEELWVTVCWKDNISFDNGYTRGIFWNFDPVNIYYNIAGHAPAPSLLHSLWSERSFETSCRKVLFLKPNDEYENFNSWADSVWQWYFYTFIKFIRSFSFKPFLKYGLIFSRHFSLAYPFTSRWFGCCL